MKKVLKTEEYYENYDEKRKRRLSLLCVAAMVLSSSLYTGATVKEKYEKKIKEITEHYEQQLEQNKEVQAEVKTPEITIYEMDEGLIEVTEPETQVIDGVTYYVAPKGFCMTGDICYRAVSWSNEEEQTNENLVARNGQVSMGNKLISIVRPKARVQNDRIVYALPEGYIKVGNYGIKVSVIAKEETNTLGR